MRTCPILSLFLGIVVAACGSDGPTDPGPAPVSYGSIAVTVVVTGLDPTEYLYGVVAGGSTPEIQRSGQRRLIHNLLAGSHSVDLFGAPANCDVAASPLTAVVGPPDTTEIIFQVDCGPPNPANVELVINGGGGLYRLNGDGTGAVFMATTPVGGSAQWSPDGSQVAFTGGSDNNPGLYLIKPDGTGGTLVSPGSLATEISWSPDASHLAFVSGGQLYVVGSDGTGLQSLTDATLIRSPSWSPDGLQLAFVYSNTISIIKPAVAGRVDLFSQGIFYGFISLQWSPAGDRIAFAYLPLNDGPINFSPSAVSAPLDGGVYVMNPDGTNLVQVGPPARLQSGLAWSPDGTRLSFLDRSLVVLSIASADGSNLASVPIPRASEAMAPMRWSADGSTLSFLGSEGIYMVRQDGAGLTKVSSRSLLEIPLGSSLTWRPW
jgi:dipeptidyl aminopeptidase/acylaminoacyl peptidase